MSDMEQIAIRAMACKGWRWMPGMLCPVGTQRTTNDILESHQMEVVE